MDAIIKYTTSKKVISFRRWQKSLEYKNTGSRWCNIYRLSDIKKQLQN